MSNTEKKFLDCLADDESQVQNFLNKHKPKPDEPIGKQIKIPRLIEISKEIDEQVRAYLSTHNVLINILTPCYGGVNHIEYTFSLIKTIELFINYGIGYEVLLIGKESLIQRARNNLIAVAMHNPNVTHMFFIDADISWKPIDVLKLIISDKELIGGIYPIKKYHFERVDSNSITNIMANHEKQYNKSISPLDFLKQNLLDYCVNFIPDVGVVNNVLEVKTLPTGFMMIKRSCIDKMIEKYEDTKYIDDQDVLPKDSKKPIYALFECGKVDGHYYSEDWMFCYRWKQIGGHVYTDVTIDLTHIGPEEFRGRFLSSLDLTQKQPSSRNSYL